MSLINYEMSLMLTWSANCLINSMERRAITATRRGGSPTVATFKITDIKLHESVVTLSTEDDNKLLKQLKSRFKRTIKWNKYRSEMSNQTTTKNLNYLTNPTVE